MKDKIAGEEIPVIYPTGEEIRLCIKRHPQEKTISSIEFGKCFWDELDSEDLLQIIRLLITEKGYCVYRESELPNLPPIKAFQS